MSKACIATLIVCLVTPHAHSQWSWQNPLPQGNALNSVACPAENVFIAVGNVGTIMRTTNGGATWEFQSSGVHQHLRGVFFHSISNGIAVGDSGTMLRTNNSGATWQPIASGVNTNLTAVTFTGTNSGFVAGWGGLIRRTTDGGNTWSSVSSGTGHRLYAVSFADASHGMAVGDAGVITRTTDGGATWDLPVTGTIMSFYDVSYVNPLTATAAGLSGTIVRTTDGGTTWDLQSGISSHIEGIAFTDADRGVVTGLGTVYLTTNGGQNWSYVGGGVGNDRYQCVRFASPTKAVVVGEYGQVLNSTDAGATWTRLTGGSVTNWTGGAYPNALYDIHCLDASRAVITSGTILLRTTDAGSTWQWQSISVGFYYGVHFSGDLGVIVGSNKTGQAAAISRTTDGGITWTNQVNGEYFRLNAVFLANQQLGIAVGNSGMILRTTNGGQNWTQIPSPTAFHLYAITFLEGNNGFITGRFGVMLRSTDGGASWTTLTSGVTQDIRGIAFADAMNGVAVTEGFFDGLVLRTTDGGTSWSSQAIAPGTAMRGVTTTSPGTYFSVGYRVAGLSLQLGRIFWSDDWGATWTQQQIPNEVGRGLGGIAAFDANTLVAIGLLSGGAILKTTNGGGVVSVDEWADGIMPAEHVLFQNYPNPFNPSTKIVYRVASREFIEFGVYDVLGRKVATLVNEVKAPGTYTVQWDASGMAAGVYFYRLQAGSLIETRKLLLLR